MVIFLFYVFVISATDTLINRSRFSRVFNNQTYQIVIMLKTGVYALPLSFNNYRFLIHNIYISQCLLPVMTLRIDFVLYYNSLSQIEAPAGFTY